MEEKTLHIGGFTCPALYHKAAGTPVVLMHGLSYTIEVWQEIGLTDALIEKHIPFLALDMPYGVKCQCHPKNREPQANIAFAAEAAKSVFGDAVPLVVGASYGGYVAMRFAQQHSVRGLLLVAPAHAFDDEVLLGSYDRFAFPIRIVWGAFDSLISGEEMRALADRLPNAKLLVYNGAAHSAYQDRPEWFRRDLLELYANAES
ncbi:MAG: alpha/beta hydrolase [Candidatus Bathyarchaeota archaeon]|nr:alpha/beta hydrolase [Candidatus Bathyarchaeota archaeon]